jgi:hypothetical protein
VPTPPAAPVTRAVWPDLDFRDAMNHLPRGDVVQDHRGRIAIGDAVGDRKEVLGLAYEKFREASIHGQRRHALATSKPVTPAPIASTTPATS